MYMSVYIYIYIYIYTSVLLCIYMHRVGGTISEADHIVMLNWWKACITKLSQILSEILSKHIANVNLIISCAICWSHSNATGNVVLVCWLAGLLACRLPMMLLAGPAGAADAAGATGAVGGGGDNNDAM